MDLPDSVQVFADQYLENISTTFKTLYNEEELSDTTIYCKEGSLKAHKLILAASSPYFCKILRENKNGYPIIILQGVSMNLMKNLIELLYNGITDVKNTDVENLNRLIKDFEIKGVNFGSNSASSDVRLEMNTSNVSSDSIHNRDTRFKGKKRVAVDYEQDDARLNQPSTSRFGIAEMHPSKKSNLEDNMYIKKEAPSPVPTESTFLSSSDFTSISGRSGMSSYTMDNVRSKPSAWAKKQRKFKCPLCPSSFKRSSHLARHQLVHTGERPYSCHSCEKAFSRHDKLKNHIKKAHEMIPDSMYEKIDQEIVDSDPESYRNDTSPHDNNAENDYRPDSADLSSRSRQGNDSPLFTISHISSILEDSFVNPPKKGRGRPRKYPPTTACSDVLNTSQQQPVSKVKQKRNRRSWIDMFLTENGDNQTSLRLRDRKNINNNEDYMFSQMGAAADNANLACELCDRPFTYVGRLKTHMRKLHGIPNYTFNEQLESVNPQNDQNVAPLNRIEEPSVHFAVTNETSINDDIHPNVEEKDIDDQEISETPENRSESNSKSKKGDNLSFEELRRLLPRECSIRPLINEKNKTDFSETKENKIVQNTGAVPEDFENPVENPPDIKNRCSSNGEKEKTSSGSSQGKVDKSRKQKWTRGIIRYKRQKQKPTSKSCVFVSKNQKDSSPPVRENQSSLLKFPQSNSAIEISIVKPNSQTSNSSLPKEIGEDLSITLLASSSKSQRDQLLPDEKLWENYNTEANGKNEEKCEPEVSQISNTGLVPIKRKRGRPRKNSVAPISFVKRGRGRPPRSVAPSIPGVQNYDLSSLPYGDLNYLTRQPNADEEEEPPVMMEPLVEISMDEMKKDTEEGANRNEVQDTESAVEITRLTETGNKEDGRIPEEGIKKERTEDGDSRGELVDISEIENKIGLIGECTISVAY